jgi:hypothetical protein
MVMYSTLILDCLLKKHKDNPEVRDVILLYIQMKINPCKYQNKKYTQEMKILHTLFYKK